MFRTKVVPIIIMLWGVSIALNVVVAGTDGSSAYTAGQLVAGALGVVIAVVALRHFLRAR